MPIAINAMWLNLRPEALLDNVGELGAGRCGLGDNRWRARERHSGDYASLRYLGRAGGSRDAYPLIGRHAGDGLRQNVGRRKMRLVFARDRGGKAQPVFAGLRRIEADEYILERH